MLLTRMVVSPMNCQVNLFAPNSGEDPPQWPTDSDPVVIGNSQWIAVSTICDIDGQVKIEVWQGNMPGGVSGEPVYDGVFVVAGAFTLVGSLTGNHLGVIPLTDGRHRVRVYTVPEDQLAQEVYFVFD
jgi:hypothetical protein